MKKLLLPFISCVLGMQLSSQNLNVANHGYFSDLPGNVITINSKSYFYYQRIAGCCTRKIFLTGISESGQTLFTDSILIQGGDTPYQLIKSNDKALVLLGSGNYACGDVGDNTPISALVKLDTLGGVVFTATVTTSLGHELINLTQHPDSSFWLTSYDTIYHYSYNGQFISASGWNFTDINSITALPNGHLLFNAKINNVLSNIETYTTGAIVHQQPATYSVIKFVPATNGDLFAKTSAGSIEKYDASLNLLNTSTTAIASGTLLSDFILRNDSVFAAGIVTAGAKPYYCIMSSSLNVLYQTQAAYKNVQPTGISITNKNKVSILARGSSVNTLMPFSSFYQLPLTGSFVSTEDIGVTRVSVLTSTFVPFRQVYDLQVRQHVEYTAEVTVRNFGVHTISSFYLNQSSFADNYTCPNYHRLFNHTILPGDSVTVQTGMVTGDEFTVSVNTPPGTAVYAPACFFTTIPNVSDDVNIDNDAQCGQTLAFVTGISSYNASSANIALFPNPFNGSFTVNGDLVIDKLEIYDMLGSVQYRSSVNAKTTDVSDANLHTGMYVLKLYTEKEMVTKKIVKE